MVDVSPIPSNWKLPGVNVTIDPSQAGTPTNLKWGLLVGHKTAAGLAPADVVTAIGTQMDADNLFGPGSMLAIQFKTFFQINKGTPVYALPVDEPEAGTAATGTITIAQAPSVAGTIALYIAGQLVSVGILGSDNENAVAAKIAAAINAVTSLPVTATAAANVVTLTAKWKGLTGNDIDVRDSYLGYYGGEQLPAGLTLTYSGGGKLSGGTGTPDFTNAIANLGDEPHKFVS